MIAICTNRANRVVAENKGRQNDLAARCPEAHLWFAVLCMALRDSIKKPGSPSSRKARAWFQSHKMGVGSFNWICDILAIECREAILRMAFYGKAEDHLRLQKILFRNR